MAGAVADRAWRDAAPDEIDAALAALWRAIGARMPVARAVLSNLVVVRACAPGEPLDAFAPALAATIDEVAGRHPSRVIVVAHESDCALRRAPIAARVGVATYGPPQARYGVEQLDVRSSCDEMSLLSIARRLIRGDLPTTIWCAGDLSAHPPLRALVAEGRQLIYDSRRWSDPAAGFRAVADAVRGLAVDIADLNWRRLAPVRRALLHAADDLPVDALRRARLRIAHASDETALAALLRGWLAVCFAWPPAVVPHVESSASGPLLTLAIDDAASAWSIELTDAHVRVRQPNRPPYALAVPHESPADAIAAEMRSLVADSVQRETVEALAR